MKVLLTFVGDQDPISEKTNEEGSIVTLVREIRPDIVGMFPSADIPGVRSSTERNALETRDWIHSEIASDIQVYIRPLSLTDATDYVQILREGEQEVQKFTSMLPHAQEAEFYLNTSSGTPQMKAAFLLWANSGFIPRARLMQVGNPLYAKQRVKELTVDFLEEVNLRNRAARYLEEGMFLVAAQELDRLAKMSVNSGRKFRAEFLAGILRAYHLWDLIQYKEAYQRLSGVLNRYGNSQDLGELMGVLEVQISYLRELSKEEKTETPHNLVDLYYNAERRALREDYTDALARFWRLYEGLLFYRLRQGYGIEPSSLNRSPSEADRDRLLRRYPYLTHYQEPELNLTTAKRALEEEFGDPLVKRLPHLEVEAQHEASIEKVSLDVLLERLRGFRNDSIVAHGMQPVERKHASWCLAGGRKLLDVFLEGKYRRLVDEYPFTPCRMQPIVGFLRAI
ncbi:MAG: hypothetical protein AB1700_15705 [Bacillota bacterium]